MKENNYQFESYDEKINTCKSIINSNENNIHDQMVEYNKTN